MSLEIGFEINSLLIDLLIARKRDKNFSYYLNHKW